MKADTKYTHIDVCPKTGDTLSDHAVYYSGGVCPHCGDADGSTITHHQQIVGRVIRPSFWERIFQGKKAEFISKEEEDKVWNGLQQ